MKFLKISVLLVVFTSGLYAQDTVKVMAYNLLNYVSSDTATRNPFFRRIVNASNPDILIVEEMTSQAMADAFLNKVMNLSGAGVYQAGVFIDGPDTDNMIYFKAGKFAFISNTPIRTDLRYKPV